MKLSEQHSDDLVLSELGRRLAGLRLNRNLTQADLAVASGVSKRTVERLEAGSVGTHLSGFLRVCRVLGLVPGLDTFIPEPEISPLAQLELAGRARRRASGTRVKSPEPAPWAWRDQP